MKSINCFSRYFALLLFLVFLTSCVKQQQAVTEEPIAPPEQQAAAPMPDFKKAPATLPVMYQNPAYMVDSDDQDELFSGSEDSILKVGATIKSTRGPQPLWDILKRLAALKKMNVSWASDVDQNVLVDVDISASDDFYGAIDNLLRQVDYFHEMQGNTIVVKYKEVRQFRIAMPFVKSNYKTGTGGNVLGSNDASSNIDGTIELKSDENEFDIWENIQGNMDTIIALWNTEIVTPEAPAAETDEEPAVAADTPQQATRRLSSGGVNYLIDKPVGIVTVTAPRPLLDELQRYFDSLTNELYKQIAIEAKIIEVQLTDNSYLGINWTSVLKNKSLTGLVTFGAGENDPDGNYTQGQVWPYVFSNEGSYNNGTSHGNIYDPTRFVSKITMDALGFEVFLNALNEQGDTKILSNPKISVMNGQPSLLTVGRNVTYIESVETDIDSSGATSLRTYTVETARILSGVGLAL
ncbi:MAG: hypothetical protein V2I35_02875, partial [Desulfocapsaceae bacterium]|nr:hypothetical protein [Desulfocapsaceae bacterium]